MSSRILYSSGRIVFVQLILLIGFCALLGRLVYLQIYQDVFLDDQVFNRLDSQYSLLAPRGKILDRNDNILALDIKGYSVGLDLEKFIYDQQTILTLSNILKKNPITLSKSLEGRLSGYKEISRNVNLETKENLKDMKIPGLYFRENLRRSYPEKDIISHVVGLTDTDRKGIQGVELIFQNELLGEEGSFEGIKGAGIQNLKEKELRL
jgi:cell division protein FtsI/penicillin-binding protein 2